MSAERKEMILSSFVYSTEPIPKLYGKLIPLDQFLSEIDMGKHKPYKGTGQLVLDGKFIENSEDWVSDRCVPFENGYLSLEELSREIDGLQVFRVTASTFLF